MMRTLRPAPFRSARPLGLFTAALALVTVLALAAGPALAAAPAMYGARAMGMGGAFTAVADDATALYWNPAALGRRPLAVNLGLGLSGSGDLAVFQALTDKPEDIEDFLKTDGEADLGVGLLIGANIGSVGVGYLVDGAGHVAKKGIDVKGGTTLNKHIALGFARDVASSRGGAMAVRIGGVVRAVESARASYTFDGVNEASDSSEGKGYGLDVGALIHVTDTFTVGATVRNVLGEMKWGDKAESPATEFRLGVAVTPPLLGGTIAADIASGGQFRYGIEKKLLFGGLKLRAGQIHSDGSTYTTGGVGFALGPVAIETAVITGGADLHYTIEAALRF